ncbi:MAG: TetR/AcrR family transcriptional regulator, partial [Burkholderiales bacterium]|nr:TetR/AcrR family transcriptional regulator [Burkholderiales bacterium]
MTRPREFDERAVVDAAMQAFWSGGLASTSVGELLQATGLSRSSMYQCIGNRDTLLELAVTRYVDEQVAAIERAFAGQPLDQAFARILDDAALDNFAGRGCLLANGVNELHARDADRLAGVQAGFARIAEALRAAIARAAPRRGDPAQRCVELMAAI